MAWMGQGSEDNLGHISQRARGGTLRSWAMRPRSSVASVGSLGPDSVTTHLFYNLFQVILTLSGSLFPKGEEEPR